MDTDTRPAASRPSPHARRHAVVRMALAGLAVLPLLGTGEIDDHRGPADSTAVAAPGSVPAAPAADLVGGTGGGVAARLHDADGTPLAGDVFLLIGQDGSTAPARVYDETPYTHGAAVHPEVAGANRLAADVVASIVGTDVEPIPMTRAAGGGSSGGLTRAIAYLDVVSNGAFTGGLRVAATGALAPTGHVLPIDYVESKTTAAHLAAADVLFTPTVPTSPVADGLAARMVGEVARPSGTGASLHDAGRLARLEAWGAERPDGMDVVDVRHLIDVSAYLCGAGSRFACSVADRLAEQAEQDVELRTAEGNSELERLRARNHASTGTG